MGAPTTGDSSRRESGFLQNTGDGTSPLTLALDFQKVGGPHEPWLGGQHAGVETGQGRAVGMMIRVTSACRDSFWKSVPRLLSLCSALLCVMFLRGMTLMGSYNNLS